MDERHGSSDPCRARSLLDIARVHERAGRTQAAAASYEAAVRACEEEGEASLLVETLRSLAIIRHRSGNDVEAYVLCRRAFDAASATGDPVLAAEALNTRASIDLTSGQIAAASEGYRQALAFEFNSPKLRARDRNEPRHHREHSRRPDGRVGALYAIARGVSRGAG